MKRLLRLARPSIRSLAALALAGVISSPASAEGTRTLHPAAGDGSTGNRGVMDVSNTLNANVVRTRQFLYVYAEANEVILLGSRNRSNSGDIFVYNPQSFGAKGNETIPATADFSCSSQAGRGTIASRDEELAGPNSADLSQTVADGFSPCWYVAPTTGIYGVRFTAANTGTTNDASISNPQVMNGDRVAAWDVTVRTSPSSLANLDGRVFTYAWTVYLQSNARFLRNALYYVSSDGFRYKQTFRNLDPNRATFYANSQGFIDDGRPLYRDVRASTQAVSSGPSFSAGVTAQAPQYPIFFSDVTTAGPNAAEVNRVLTALAIPLAPAAPLLANPTFVGNLNGNQSTVSAGGVFTFDTQNTLTYEIVISFDGVNFDPAEVDNRVITGTALTGSHTVLWDGLNNNGVAFPAGDYEYRIYGRNGEIHFPMLDVEGNSWGGPTLEKLNGFQPADRFTVYYDDRGYRAANGTAIGALNGHLCGAGSPIAPPTPTHSLAGVDSSAGGPGSYYRRWSGSSDSNSDCTANANEFFATAKGLDLWALERSPEVVLPIEIVDPADGVDVGTQVSVTSTVLPGGTAYGSFVFTNAGDDPATGVSYSATIGNPLDPATCPASVNFTLLPAGVTATYNPAPLCTVTFGGAMPTTLNPGDSLGFNFNYVVAVVNPGPIPVNTTIAAGNENCAGTCAPNAASAQTLVARPVITVAKTATPASDTGVNTGATIDYTIAVTIANAPLTAALTLDDTLSAGLTFGSVSSANPAFDCSSAPDCTLPAGTPLGTYTVVYTATVDATAGATVSNTVVATGGGDEDGPACSPAAGGCATEHPVNRPDLTIAKTGPAAAVVGVAYTYTLTATNNGTADATANANVTDTVPTGLTINSAGPGCTVAGQVVTCTIAQGDLQMAESVVITINVTPTAAAGASVSNVASITGGGDPDCAAVGDCDSPPVVTTLNAPNLAIAKSGPATAVVGVSYNYTLTLTNTGTADATASATVMDTVPPGLTINSASPGCTVAGQIVTCAVAAAALQVGESVVITINVTPTAAAGASVSNVAGVTGGGDPDCAVVGDCDSPPVVTALNAPNLEIAKSGPATAVVGVAFDYTLTVSNTGTADATANATVSDTVPVGLTINTAGPGCAIAGQLVTCTVAQGDLQVGESVVITINVTPTAAAGTSVSNLATVSGGGDPDCVTVGVCNSPPVVTTLNAPTLDIAKSGPATAVVGVAFDYVLTVSNTGTADAIATATLSDTVPAGLTVNTAGPGCAIAGQLVTCTVAQADLQVGESAVITINVTPTATAVPSVSNTASVIGGGDPACVAVGDCDSPPVVTVVAAPQVAVSKSATPGSGAAVEPGDTVTYTLTVSVTDAATTADLVLTDTLDAQLENIQPVSNPGGFTLGGAGNTRTFTLPAGAAIGTHAVSYSADVVASATGTVGNNVTIDGANNGGDPDPSCTVCATTHPLASDVTLLKTLAAEGNLPIDGIAAPGETLTYAITLTNSGGVDATGYAVTDLLDANVLFVSADNGGVHAAGTVTWSGLTVPAGDGVVLTVVVQVVDPLPAPVTQVVNRAFPTGEPTPACPSAGCVEIPVPQVPNLSLVKDASLDDGNGNALADANETIGYVLTATNTGNVALTDVIIDDPRLPALSCTPVQPAALAIGESLVCTGNYTVTQADVDAGVAIDNTATATAPDPTDPDPLNPTLPPLEDEDSTSTPVAPATPGIELLKEITAGSPYTTAGDTIAYRLTATNTGNVTLANVSIADPLLATVTCTPVQPATLAPLATLVCTGTHTVTPVDIDNGSVTNTATVTATPPGGGMVEDTDDAIAAGPEAGPAIEVEKVRTDTAAPVVAGTVLAYQVVATNIGNVSLGNVTVSDPLIPGLSCIPTMPATLAAGDSITCTGNYIATQGDVDAGEVSNTATATGTPPGPAGTPPVTDSDDDLTTIPATPALEVIKVASLNDTNGNGAGDQAETIDYAVSVRNTGNVTLSDLAVTDSLDGAAATVLTCAPTTLAPNEAATCNAYSHTITLAEALAGEALVNVATAMATDPNGDEVSDDDTASTPLGDVVADLAIQKTGPANGAVGDEVTFTIVVTNLGPSTAVNTVLVDPTPAGLQFVANDGDCTTAFPCDLGDLALGGTRTVQSTFLIPTGYTGPTTIVNIASVTSDSPDPTPGDTSSSASTIVGSGFAPIEPAVIPASRHQSLVLLAILMMLMASGALRRKW